MTQAIAIPAPPETPVTARLPIGHGLRVCRDGPRHYQIGPVSVRVRSDLPEVEAQFEALYAAYESDPFAREAFRIDVIARRSRRSLRRYYHILGNGEELFVVRRARSVLPHVEWAVNLLVLRYLPGFLQIHAAVVSRGGVGMIFPGTPGAGKTTLAAALLTRGWSYLSDEFALIDPDTHLLNAYPKALCIKQGSFEALTRLGLPLDTTRAYLKGEKGRVTFLDPRRVRPDIVSKPCRAGMVVFPEYSPGGPPAIEPMSRARAVFELTRVSFNFPRCRTAAFHLLADVVSRARCYRLRGGEIEETCQLVEDCLDQAADRGPLHG